MRIRPSCLVACALLAFGAGRPAAAQTRDDTRRLLPDLHLSEPPWASGTMFRESVLPLQEQEDGPVVGRLAFPAEELIAVRSADGARELAPGKDFELGPDRRTLVFLPDARVPFVKAGDLYPALGSPDSYAHRAGDPTRALMYHPGRWFHDRQFEVTYCRAAAEWTEAPPAVAEAGLPRTLAKLRAGSPVTVVVAGDSIAAGGDASLLSDAPPRMPAFPELVAAALEQRYGGPVTLKNLAVGGTSVRDGVAAVPKYAAERPDLLVVAFGMNDVGRRDPDWFRDETRKLVAGIREALPEVEVLLVSPMLGNPEWVHTPREMFAAYRDALAGLTGAGAAMADVTAAWEILSRHKNHLDMTGNGLNHPNDFGHRVYAQTVLGTLVPPAGSGTQERTKADSLD